MSNEKKVCNHCTLFFAPCRRGDRFAYIVNACILLVPLSTFIAQHLIYFENAACIYSQCLCFAFAPVNYFAQTTSTTVAGCASPRLARVAGFVAAKQRKRSDDVAERYIISNCPDYTQNKGSHAKQEKRKSVPCRRNLTLTARFAYYANACILLVPLSYSLHKPHNTTVAGCASPRLARVAGFVAAKQRKRSDNVAERYIISNCPDYTQNKGSHAKQEKRKSVQPRAHFSLRP